MKVGGVGDTTSGSLTNGISKNVMGKEDFLKLMVTQLQNQDPLNPMKNEEYVTQLAQFSSLEQMTNLNKSMDALVGMNTDMQAAGMIGRNVMGLDDKGNQVTGIVTSIEYTDNVPVAVLGSTRLPMTSIAKIW